MERYVSVKMTAFTCIIPIQFERTYRAPPFFSFSYYMFYYTSKNRVEKSDKSTRCF